ncbi:unnamed protein product [Leptosia nina]|uniref:Uncharacterized protein n=1 Tax=Leptosia nina TaxID=320188 RepID=A0AAV1K721_9NEOP
MLQASVNSRIRIPGLRMHRSRLALTHSASTVRFLNESVSTEVPSSEAARRTCKSISGCPGSSWGLLACGSYHRCILIGSVVFRTHCLRYSQQIVTSTNRFKTFILYSEIVLPSSEQRRSP